MVTPLGLGSPHRGCIPAPPRGAGLWQAGPPGGRGTRSRTGLRHPAREAGPRVLQGFPRTPACDRALSSDACACLSLPRAISCMLEIWLDYYRDDFCQLPAFPSLRKLLQLLSHHLPGSDVEVRAWRYLRQFRCLHAAKPEAGGEEAWEWLSWGQMGPPDPASVQLGREQGVGSHPTPWAAAWGHLPGLLPSHTGSGGKSGLDLGGSWTVRPGGDTLSSWIYSFGPRKTP